MAYHNRRNPRDALDALHQNTQRVSDAHQRMSQKTTHTVQVNDIEGDEVQDPVEGEVRIDHTDNKIAWRVNNAWHKPGGDPVWAAIYSQRLLWGHTVSSTGNNLELFGPSYDQSDGSTGLFSFTQYADPDSIMPQIFRLTIHASGLYTFNMNVAWYDAEVPEMRNTYFIARHSGGSFNTPGDISQPFVNIKLSASQYHNLNNFSDWDITHAVSWSVPVLISAPCEIKPMVAHEAVNAAGNVVTVDNPYDLRFFVIRHGSVDHVASAFNELD